MKGFKLTLGALAALALALSSGCQTQTPQVSKASDKAEQPADRLDARYYRVQLADLDAKDVNWALFRKELGEQAIKPAKVSAGFDDPYSYSVMSPGGKLRVTGLSESKTMFQQSGVLESEVTPEAFLAALSKQGKVEKIEGGQSNNVLKPTDVDGRIHQRAQQLRGFLPQVQCSPEDSIVDLSDVTSFGAGYWLTAFNVDFTPMQKANDRIRFDVRWTVVSEGKVPDCDYLTAEKMTTEPGKSSRTYGHTADFKLGQSYFMSGMRELGIDRSLEYVDPRTQSAGAEKKLNEVLVLVLTPSMQ
ncbi:hypothetical protein [Pseudomonas serbica]|uniref:hypothetical protein n=1 Tax=Pseudomonas serbica TaxID=2965074 RepID=UPI00237BF439|nr:hypothetical protein [Pseudomonas serbica]